MTKELMNLGMFLAICFAGYILFRGLNYNLNFKEGMTDNSASSSHTAISGANAAAYAAALKSETVKLQDTFLISKYRKDFETVILNLEDYINCKMLSCCMALDTSKDNESHKILSELSTYNNAKSALNNVMKFVDKSK